MKRIYNFLVLILLIPFIQCHEDDSSLDKYNIVYTSPSKDAKGSMPLGNGDIGVNAWVDEQGDLIFYLGKTDAWSENCRLLKVGKVRVSFNPSLVGQNIPYKQELQFRNGMFKVNLGEGADAREIKMWVDANNPVVKVNVSGKPFKARVSLELWRTQRRLKESSEDHSFYSMDPNLPIFIEPDTVFKTTGNNLMWAHHNRYSCYKESLDLQGMSSYEGKDPLLHRTFGGIIEGSNLEKKSDVLLETKDVQRSMDISVVLNTTEEASLEEWENSTKSLLADVKKEDEEKAFQNHCLWWNNFWNRSYVNVEGKGTDKVETEKINTGWISHRFLMGCAGRGKYPIKFNGSNFNVDGKSGDNRNGDPGEKWDADYRRWGQPYWFQNERQIYWPMLAAGDFDLMLPFCKMYFNMLPFSKKRTQIYYNHKGAFFPETLMFWGGFADRNYGYDRKNKPLGLTDNTFIRRYWQGGLELSCMMLEYYKYTQNQDFLKKTALPIIREVLIFYFNHWPVNTEGKFEFFPAQALETYQNVKNPLPDIAGLKKVSTELLDLPEGILSTGDINLIKENQKKIPDLPKKKNSSGEDVLVAAQEIYQDNSNMENVALYSVFPYHLYGVGMPDIDLALRSYNNKKFDGIYRCWHNDPVYAAFLGNTKEARKSLGDRFVLSGKFRYPAFYIMGDWTPDHDNGGVAQQTLHAMLLQNVGKRILLFPAWPKEWNVHFKLHAYANTIVEVELKNGKIRKLNVIPESRKKDVEILLNSNN